MTEHKNSRRDVLKMAGGTLTGLAVTACASTESAVAEDVDGIAPQLIAHAEKVAGVEYTLAEREQMQGDLEQRLQMIQMLRAVDKPNTLAPSLTFDPRLPGQSYPTRQQNRVTVTPARSSQRPDDETVAFASIRDQAAWLRSGALSSVELTEIYLNRIAAHAGKLECFVTVMGETARRDAAAMDADLRAGRDRGPLHGIPYALKDLFDAEGIKTTWGAEIYKDQMATSDSTIVRQLREAGAVLLGKTTCGALAYGDIWFGGVTRNPFDPREGSSGSSAGSASATAAGLCAFSIGTETLGSLVSPSMRCGTTALRPTFGRVSRAGGMALCWSLDKVGPMTRYVEDSALIMAAINGYDSADASSIAAGFECNTTALPTGMVLGLDEAWLEAASDVEKNAIQIARGLGLTVKAFKMPDLPAAPLVDQLMAEAAAAFEEMTLTNADDRLTWQEDAAWPNSFRAARFITAIDLIQIDRLRRKWMQAMHEAMDGLDVIIGPSFSSGLLTPTNFTGHPCLAMRAGFEETRPRTIFGQPQDEAAAPARTPVAISMWAPLFQEGPMMAVGARLERALNVAGVRPQL